MSLSSDILSLIPQRTPFVMLSTLEQCDETGASSTFRVAKENLFVENNLLTEPALVENIAQTAAARMGYICKQENKPVPVGFIGAVQNLKIIQLPNVGSTISTSISIKNQIFNATIIEGRIMESENLIAHCEMKIFISTQ